MIKLVWYICWWWYYVYYGFIMGNFIVVSVYFVEVIGIIVFVLLLGYKVC